MTINSGAGVLEQGEGGAVRRDEPQPFRACGQRGGAAAYLETALNFSQGRGPGRGCGS